MAEGRGEASGSGLLFIIYLALVFGLRFCTPKSCRRQTDLVGTGDPIGTPVPGA